MAEFRPNILVVDDEAAICRTLSSLLRANGYSCVTETDPTAALQLYSKQTFHIVLTDLVMPEMDGLEFVRQLKEQGQTPEIVVITAFSTLERAVEAHGLGVADYLLKPFKSLDDVLCVVQTAEARLARWREIMMKSMTLRRRGEANEAQFA